MSLLNEKEYQEKVRRLNVIKLDDSQKARITENKRIGIGGFGKVMSGKYLTLPIAIKKMKVFKYEDFYREINVVRQFRHPNVPYLYLLYNEGSTLNLVNELIDGMTLDDYIKKIKPSEIEILCHMLDLAVVLNCFHHNNMIHRDLKPSNVMLNSKLDVKLLDFGISKITQNKTFTTTIAMGTILYMAPENFDTSFMKGQTMNEIIKSRITGRVDVWAFGCMLSEIFSKHKPWAPKAKDDTSVMSHLFTKKEFHIPDNISKHRIVPLIRNCTVVDENMRYNFITTIRDMRKIITELVAEKGQNLEESLNYLKPKSSIN